jgi:hypothetical protein
MKIAECLTAWLKRHPDGAIVQLNDHNFQKESGICAERRCILFDGVTSAEYFDSHCHTNFTAK